MACTGAVWSWRQPNTAGQPPFDSRSVDRSGLPSFLFLHRFSVCCPCSLCTVCDATTHLLGSTAKININSKSTLSWSTMTSTTGCYLPDFTHINSTPNKGNRPPGSTWCAPVGLVATKRLMQEVPCSTRGRVIHRQVRFFFFFSLVDLFLSLVPVLSAQWILHIV